jgi:hypothetical protein
MAFLSINTPVWLILSPISMLILFIFIEAWKKEEIIKIIWPILLSFLFGSLKFKQKKAPTSGAF